MNPKRLSRNRRGSSLLETLIATAILLIALAALGTQASVGVRAAERIQLEGLSAILCQSQLDELVATHGFENRTMRPISGNPGWFYSSRLSEIGDKGGLLVRANAQNLAILSVTTWKEDAKGDSRKTLKQTVRKKHSISSSGRTGRAATGNRGS